MQVGLYGHISISCGVDVAGISLLILLPSVLEVGVYWGYD